MEKEFTVTIDRLSFGGDGVGRVEGKVVFVPLTVPGDKVRVRVVSDHGRFDLGEVIEILEPSPQRVSPRCSVFGRCGGCQWQQLDYTAQLHAKEEILKETLERGAGLKAPKILPILASPKPWNYRNRIQIQVNSTGEMGFHARGSHEVIPFEQCEIADELLNEEMGRLRKNNGNPKERFELVVGEKGKVQRTNLTAHSVFVQVNPAQAEPLRKTVFHLAFGGAEKAFTQKWRAVDLYSGVGNFSLPLAERVAHLTAIDENREALAKGEAEALRHGRQNIEWVLGHAEWGLKKVYRRREAIDLLLLDPPRNGAKEILDLVLLIAPRRIVYVSCDPTTLARDIKVLVHRKYRLDEVQPIDLFPQTYHIESVARLTLV